MNSLSNRASISSFAHELGLQLLCACVYFVLLGGAFWLSSFLETAPESSAIYLPAGVKLAFALLLPYRFWPNLWLTSRLFAAYLGLHYNQQWQFELWHGFWQEAFFFTTLWLFKNSRWQVSLRSSQGVLAFLLLATLSCFSKWLLFGSAFEFTTWLTGDQLLQYQINMSLGDLTGIILLTPLLMALAACRWEHLHLAKRKLIHLYLVLACLLVLSVSIYLLRPDTYGLLRLASLLPIIWFCYQFGMLGAICSATLINGLFIVEASLTQQPSNTYISQLFILANGITSLVLGAAINELKHNNQALQKNNSELQALLQKNIQLAGKMVQVQESERKHLSQELHDELGQNLTALKTDLAILSQLGDKAAAAIISDLKNNANSMYDSVYQLMHYLRPRELDELGLAAALKQGQCAALLQKAGIEYQCRLELHSHVPEGHQIALYRISQEAITNCIKHSNASLLRLTINLAKDHLELHIQDNGVALRPCADSGHYGLTFIKERALALGGVCRFSTDDGFTIDVSLPLSTPHVAKA
ncbi:MASE1 domain-containing protein [Pseudoalteromonas sp. BDTF-M6]|uniref:MASE1 domain-containing protein n=1 Tax=Pseudoalteromonas sp. BDTF-M6 TaxID=2796132 RepID=UPI001BAE946D|nr:MASE1 domain-containing protein [Pseudoalteromonas sp. BDTF-M6]MBS3798533.1 MASE1 domain-containing protein [Pseudoalteromonas sp. BDTF-M6]